VRQRAACPLLTTLPSACCMQVVASLARQGFRLRLALDKHDCLTVEPVATAEAMASEAVGASGAGASGADASVQAAKVQAHKISLSSITGVVQVRKELYFSLPSRASGGGDVTPGNASSGAASSQGLQAAQAPPTTCGLGEPAKGLFTDSDQMLLRMCQAQGTVVS
jgi:hypothetical protein